MSRRGVSIGVTVVVLVLAVLAASSGDVTLWEPPSPREPGAAPAAADEEDVDDSDDDDDPIVERSGGGELPSWMVQVIVVVVCLAIVVAAVAAARSWRPRAGGRARRRGNMSDVLPPDAEPAVRIDGVAARSALAEGSPRNGIVACWMQLERDAAQVGLARRDAETSSEYVERVVAASSIDVGPIGELAALFREARFSDHDMGEDRRQRAVDALLRVEATLRTAEVAAP